MTNISTLSGQEKAYFTTLFNNIADAWNKGNRDPYIDMHSGAVYMVPHSETLVGEEAIREFVIDFPDISVEFNAVDAWGNSNLANIHGKYSLVNSDGSLLDKGKFLSDFEKSSDGKWKMTHTIWNSDLPLPE